MKSNIKLRTIPWLFAAGLAFGAAGAQGASGVTITQSQETTVGVGLSAAQVEQILGPPAAIFRYGTGAGPTWTYVVNGVTFGTTDFDVDFGSDGKVMSVGERVRGDKAAVPSNAAGA